MLLPATATVAYSFKVDRFPQHGEFPANGSGDLDFIERVVVKINDPFTFYTPEVLMLVHSGIKSFRIARTLYN